MNKKLDLLVLSNVAPGARPFGAQGYFFRELGALAEQQGLSVGVADVLSGENISDMQLYDVQGTPLGRNDSVGAYYDRLAAGWDRASSKPTRVALEDEERVFNPLHALDLMGDKLATYERLTAVKLPSPLTVSVEQVLASSSTLDLLPDALVLKPRSGSQGSGVKFVNRSGHSLAWDDGGKITNSDLTGKLSNYLLQEDVGHPEILEVRTLVQRRGRTLTAIGSYAKVSKEGALGNISLGAQARSIQEIPEFPVQIPIDLIETNAVAACLAIDECTTGELFEAGVDQAVTREGASWILEVNGRPARFGFELIARHASSFLERKRYAAIRRASVQSILDYALDRN
ncbi:YheC/YheD family protein [Kribbella sp. NBC_01484]|uniref:YheC/YheD family protein n=1 Tax=Kribbella sp. NBC_01484 TaxID=2903579 RepID=UPI002E36B1FE|nr:YheC/YheD family protein [Kribbella sp. NBC_01484]